jgi:hypothetical protein
MLSWGWTPAGSRPPRSPGLDTNRIMKTALAGLDTSRFATAALAGLDTSKFVTAAFCGVASNAWFKEFEGLVRQSRPASRW